MHHGRVEALHEGANKGSEFVIHLPVTTDDSRPHPTVHADHSESPNGSSPPRRLLVVDDNEDSLNSLATLLRMTGNDVRTAIDGPSALEAAEHSGPRSCFSISVCREWTAMKSAAVCVKCPR